MKTQNYATISKWGTTNVKWIKHKNHTPLQNENKCTQNCQNEHKKSTNTAITNNCNKRSLKAYSILKRKEFIKPTILENGM